MSNTNRPEPEPIKTPDDGLRHIIDRDYIAGSSLQWLREATANAHEAGAKNITFGFCHIGGAVKRTIVDDGKGMSDSELIDFFNYYGAGSKAIGGVEDNFGIGAKSSLLPWNKEGVCVISRCDGEEANMIIVKYSNEKGAYYLKEFEVEDEGYIKSYPPCYMTDIEEDLLSIFNDKLGSSSSSGTMILLLGNNLSENNLIDPNKEGKKANITTGCQYISGYVNKRFWNLPLVIKVEEYNIKTDKVGTIRSPCGLATFLKYRSSSRDSLTSLSGKISTDKGTISWFLWDHGDDNDNITSYAFGPFNKKGGGVFIKYKNEIYPSSLDLNDFKDFGIYLKEIASYLHIVIEPHVSKSNGNEITDGVFPNSARSKLSYSENGVVANDIPYKYFGAFFSSNKPVEIKNKIDEINQQHSCNYDDNVFKRRTKALLGMIGIEPKNTKKSPNGSFTVLQNNKNGNMDEKSPKSEPKNKETHSNTSRTTRRSKKVLCEEDIPRIVISELNNGFPVVYDETDSTDRKIIIDISHPLIKECIEYWNNQFSEDTSEIVVSEIKSSISLAVCHILNASTGSIPRLDQRKKMLAPESLMVKLMGYTESSAIQNRLNGRYGSQKIQKAIS